MTGLFGGKTMRHWLEDFAARDFKDQLIRKLVNQNIPDEEIDRAIRSIPIHYVVGAASATADGNSPLGIAARQGKTLEQTVAQAHGKYYEAVSRGMVFAAADQAAGITVANASTLTTAAQFSLYNPPGTNARRIQLLRRFLVFFTGGTTTNTWAAGVAYDCVNTSAIAAAPSGGTLLTNQCLDVGGGGGSVGVARSGPSTTVAPVAIKAIAYMPPIVGTSALQMFNQSDDLDGLIVLEPGTCYQMQCLVTGAGTTPKTTHGAMWMEIPVI